MAVFVARDAAQVREIIAWAVAEVQPLELLGGGSKRPIGAPLDVPNVLDLSGLSGVIEYEPAELVLTARAATPLDEIEALLAQRNQRLAFEPGDWRRLLGTGARRQTIGGVLACNLAGPRRIAAGAARDHFLGFHAVSGRGEAFKAGGKVVKNVTGYDLCKLLAGSHGTLAALTEVTVKVLPRPETSATMLLLGLDDAAAGAVMTEAMGTPHEVSGAAHVPAVLASRSAVVGGAGAAVTALRLEGPAPSVAYRIAALREQFGTRGPADVLDDAPTGALWREIGDAAVFVALPDHAVWRVSVPPSAGPGVAARVARQIVSMSYYDWAGGLVWLAVVPGPADGGAAAVRAAIADVAGGDGHATLLRAPAEIRAAVPVFQPLPAGVAALAARVKQGFDPRGVLNPGRMGVAI